MPGPRHTGQRGVAMSQAGIARLRAQLHIIKYRCAAAVEARHLQHAPAVRRGNAPLGQSLPHAREHLGQPAGLVLPVPGLAALNKVGSADVNSV